MSSTQGEAELLVDVYSTKARKQYGRKGDKVRIIADHLTVLIVEGSKGDRYTVTTDEIGRGQKATENTLVVPTEAPEARKEPAPKMTAIPGLLF